ncbi:MAG TPA: NifU N-terminal domain-containing protein [Acidimicrobiales bacterium]
MPSVTATATTPNPDAMKFTLDVRVEGMVNARTEQEAMADPLAAAVLALPGVASVFRTADFLTVTREADVPWDQLIAAVEAAVAEGS